MAKREAVLTRERVGQPSGKRYIVAEDDDVLPGHNTRGPQLDRFVGRGGGQADHTHQQPEDQEEGCDGPKFHIGTHIACSP